MNVSQLIWDCFLFVTFYLEISIKNLVSVRVRFWRFDMRVWVFSGRGIWGSIQWNLEFGIWVHLRPWVWGFFLCLGFLFLVLK